MAPHGEHQKLILSTEIEDFARDLTLSGGQKSMLSIFLVTPFETMPKINTLGFKENVKMDKLILCVPCMKHPFFTITQNITFSIKSILNLTQK